MNFPFECSAVLFHKYVCVKFPGETFDKSLSFSLVELLDVFRVKSCKLEALYIVYYYLLYSMLHGGNETRPVLFLRHSVGK